MTLTKILTSPQVVTTVMFATGAAFAFSTINFYPEWSWLPQTPEQAILKASVVIMLFICVVAQKIDELMLKLDGK